MKRTKEEAKETRKSVLDAALYVFSRKGYAAAALEEIAEEAGLTRGAIYHHFGSKEKLYIALTDGASAQAWALVDLAIEEGGTFTEIISRIMIYHANLLEDDSHYREVVMLTSASSQTSSVPPALKERRHLEAKAVVDKVAGYFRMGIAQGELRADLDPYAGARAMLSLQNGLAYLWLANPNAFSLKESVPALIDVFLRGIAPR
jgi:TetR/AcrR family transcriptional regulator, acrAB operon repressor